MTSFQIFLLGLMAGWTSSLIAMAVLLWPDQQSYPGKAIRWGGLIRDIDGELPQHIASSDDHVGSVTQLLRNMKAHVRPAAGNIFN